MYIMLTNSNSDLSTHLHIVLVLTEIKLGLCCRFSCAYFPDGSSPTYYIVFDVCFVSFLLSWSWCLQITWCDHVTHGLHQLHYECAPGPHFQLSCKWWRHHHDGYRVQLECQWLSNHNRIRMPPQDQAWDVLESFKQTFSYPSFGWSSSDYHRLSIQWQQCGQCNSCKRCISQNSAVQFHSTQWCQWKCNFIKCR